MLKVKGFNPPVGEVCRLAAAHRRTRNMVNRMQGVV